MAIPLCQQPRIQLRQVGLQIPLLTLSHGWRPARAGSPLTGRDAHPLDDTQSSMESLLPPIPFAPQGLVTLDFLSVAMP
jgi:hypothetical protein